jgi:hypothetical protein
MNRDAWMADSNRDSPKDSEFRRAQDAAVA